MRFRYVFLASAKTSPLRARAIDHDRAQDCACAIRFPGRTRSNPGQERPAAQPAQGDSESALTPKVPQRSAPPRISARIAQERAECRREPVFPDERRTLA